MKTSTKVANIQQNIDLSPFNTFGIHARARYFSAIHSLEDLSTLLQDPRYKSVPKLILGGGSNILFTQDFDGLVIKNEIIGIETVSEDADHIWLKVGAGQNWHEFVLYCVAHGLGGVENLSLIPGTVGAAPIQNIGAYGVELKDVFHELEAVRLADGEIEVFNADSCQFGYRESVFKSIYKNQFVITSVTLRLDKNPVFNTSYDALQKTLKEKNVTQLSLKDISDAVIQIRRSKLPDPKEIGNAGSFFKNPIIPEAQFIELKKQFPNVAHFATESSEFTKISAGWLIEQCGWKGRRIGEVGVYDKQALVIVNYGAGTGAEIQNLVKQIQKSVFDKFDVNLTPEVNLI